MLKTSLSSLITPLQALLRHSRRWLALVVMALALLLPEKTLIAPPSRLDDVRTRDFLQVVTRNSPTTYYRGRQGPTGFEYELARDFADYLGVSLSMDAEHNIESLTRSVRDDQADFAAATLPLDLSEQGLRFTRPILELQAMVVYRRGMQPPRELEDLVGKRIGVIKGAGTSLILHELQQQLPELSWKETGELEVADLLQRIEEDSLDVAVVYAHQFKLNRLFFPNVENGFTVGDPLTLAWAFPAQGDISLLSAANDFLETRSEDGTLDQLVDQYFGHDDYLEYVGARTFIRQARERLPRYIDTFKQAARDTGIDWKLLAAVGYQESHWQPKATSPTGVRGLMMLTNATAREMNVANRLDPVQSIDGGSRYLVSIKGRLPEGIQEPDRTWMTLAAYNVGLGHLLDARRIVRMKGGNPDHWKDVREALPLLQKRQWYQKVRYGYARGGEPVIYVRNIRRYYEILNYVYRSQQQFYQLNERQITDDEGDNNPFDTVPPIL
ncbi:membrane-bound lytic murein transglycosylase MltF [Cobetia marina]|uniref:membrane-bound lytic murein transglycosylase MltF n=1 Tax=Cobetia marina TaxID=28258 RepID=UPI0010AE385F|nr:membrane-bound lytic murein transglycosylase MltF [Cobetia marina]GED43662.1 membrane-bound lytic murein transglycosylase F [Cobetia marina]